jgi:uncharacterized protein (TIGR02646 family)
VNKAKRTIEMVARLGKPQSKDFPNHWGNEDVRRALWDMQHHKCCYCERKREKNRESDVEHFRPKADVTEANPNHKGYWWLAYHWENLLFSCRYCNQQFKQNHFPIPDESKRARTPTNSIIDEQAFLIDPAEEDPEEHICFDWYELPSATDGERQMLAYVRHRTEKGSRTIEIAGLNGGDLPVERGSLVLELEALAIQVKVKQFLRAELAAIQKIGEKIREATSSKKPFTAFRRDFFRKNGLAEFVNDD